MNAQERRGAAYSPEARDIVERSGRRPSGNGWSVFGLVVGALVVVAVAANAKDLYRYLKISNM